MPTIGPPPNATLQIRDLPEEMSQLTKLEELRLAENQLEVLPGWVARMVALKIVDLRYNERLVSTLHATSTVSCGARRWLSLARQHFPWGWRNCRGWSASSSEPTSRTN